MKYLILLLLSFNSFAATKFVMTDLRNNSIQGTKTFDTEELAIARLVKIAKIKNGWRKGEFNEVLLGSLYSKQFPTYDNMGMQNGEVTKYYHPLNWSYELSDVTQELADKKAIRDAEKEEKLQLKAMKQKINDSDLPPWHKRILKMYIKSLRE